MSGGQLCGLLGELGYEGHKSLDPDSFEWPFQYEDARPILDWLCSSLRPSNVLTASELQQYEQFIQDGKLLEGEDLDFAYESISAFSRRRDNQETVFGAEEGLKDIMDATLAYKAEAVELQRQLGHLQSQYDMLSTQASALIQGKRARVASTSTVNGQLNSIDDSLSARNLEMNAVLGRIASTAQELAHFHSGEEDGIYLAYSDFNPYLLVDSLCMKELNQWFVKQLDTNLQLKVWIVLLVDDKSKEGLKDIMDATLAYKAEAVELQRQLGHLQSQYDMLSTQASALIQGKRARVASTSTVNGQLNSIDDSLSARNLEMNAVLGRIASTAQELAHFHSGEEDGIYLAYSDFNPYLLVDSLCMKELNQWFVKQLDTGPYRLVAEEGKSKCSWVNLDDVSNTLVRDSQKSQHQRVSELQRLRSIFGTSERQWVEAQVENAKQQAILLVLKGQVNSDEAHIHLDLHSLRRKHVELAAELSNLHNKEEKLLSELQDTYILQGDYDLKVMRQEYYIQRQKAFINHLINQLARHQFLKLACQFEKKTMLGAFALLKVIESELQGYLSATKGRVGRCLALIQAASGVQEQGAVDDRDTFLHGVRDLLSIHSNVQGGLSTYVSAPGLVQQISSLQSDLMALQSDLDNALPEDRSRCINELCTLIQSLQQLLFASSTTAQPILTPRTLMKELDEMEKVNAKLSAAVEEVTLEHCKKNEIVKHHSQEMALQRQVFVDFFCNPDRLRNQVRELTARVRALQASSIWCGGEGSALENARCGVRLVPSSGVFEDDSSHGLGHH
nr:augmin subunit 3 [Tanacetum cinerariifolium]